VDTHVHADHARSAIASRHGPFDLDRERDKPAVGSAADDGGQDAGGALLQPPRQLPGGLMRLEYPDARQVDVLAVGQHADGTSGEAAGDPSSSLVLPPWEAHRSAPATAATGVVPVLERPRQRVQAAVVGLLGILGPPRRHVILGPVPLPSQFRKRPRHPHVLAGLPLVHAGVDQLQAPVVGEPGRAEVGGEAALLAWGGIEGELVGLEHRGHHDRCLILGWSSCAP
jgi:hypothetical protein